MFLPLVIYTTIASIFAILQTNVFSWLSFHAVLPDFSYIVLIYFSFMYGTMPGQIAGFSSGLIIDFISLSPLGFNAFIRTVCGHIVGRFKGSILLDILLLPMAVIGISMILKALVVLVLSPIVGFPAIISRQFSLQGLIEFLFTILISPLIFWPLRGIHYLIQSRRAYK